MKALWINTDNYNDGQSYPPVGTEVIFLNGSKPNTIPYKIRSGIVVEGSHPGCVKEHGTGKLFYPYLNEIIVPGSEVYSVGVELKILK